MIEIAAQISEIQLIALMILTTSIGSAGLLVA